MIDPALITFLKELAHLATLVDKHGAQAIAEFDPEEAYAAQHGRAFPEEHEGEIKLDPDWGITIDSKLKELLKAKTLRDLADVRGANIGVSTTDESLPIIFDY